MTPSISIAFDDTGGCHHHFFEGNPAPMAAAPLSRSASIRHVTLAQTKWGVVPVYPSMQFSIHFSWAGNDQNVSVPTTLAIDYQWLTMVVNNHM